MNRQKKPLGHTMLRTKVAASATLLALALTPAVAQAAPSKAPISSDGVYVTILSPTPGSNYDASKQVEVSAFYQASSNDGGVTTLELYIDGHQAAKKTLDSPEARGVVSFLIDPSVLTPGNHHIVVRAAAADAEVDSAATQLSITGSDDGASLNGGTAISDTPPQIFIASPSPDATVAGTVKIKVNAHDDSGKPPYVSLFIDHAFKTLRNYPPFTFDWDTTRVTNGYHTIEVYGYNDAQQVGHAEPMRVLVNNPGGHTIVRHDLSDTPKISVKPTPKKSEPATAHARLVKSTAPTPSSVQAKATKTAAKPGHKTAKAAAKHNPLLAQGSSTFKPEALPNDVPLMDDNQIAQMAPEVGGQLSNVTPSPIANGAKAATMPGSIKKASAARSAANGSPALAGALSHTGGMSLLVPQNLASADTNEAPADGIEPQTMLSSPFIHPAPASPVEVPRSGAIISPGVADAHSHGTPALAQGSAPKGDGSVEMASADLTPGNVNGQDLFDGSARLETPTLSQKDLALPTHKVVSVPQGGSHLIPLFAGNATDPQVLARARGSYRMVFDAQPLSLDRPVQVRGSILFAPFRQIFESQGGTLLWVPEDRRITAISPTREIELTIGSRDALVNNQTLSLVEAPYLLSGRTMVPLSFLPLALDVSVSFDASTGHLIINSNK